MDVASLTIGFVQTENGGLAMRCLNCSSSNVFVVDSRQREDCRKRRYECADCGERFNTLENYEAHALFFNGEWADKRYRDEAAKRFERDVADIISLIKFMTRGKCRG